MDKILVMIFEAPEVEIPLRARAVLDLALYCGSLDSASQRIEVATPECTTPRICPAFQLRKI
jgi:hypothetical protein